MTATEAERQLQEAVLRHAREEARVAEKERAVAELGCQLPTIDPDERRGAAFASLARKLSIAREELAALKVRAAEAVREINNARAALATIEREVTAARLEQVRAEIRGAEAEGVRIGLACRDALWALAERQRERVAEAHMLEKALAPS